MSLSLKPVRIGCSGWIYKAWKASSTPGLPQRRWLARYAEVFDTVEVNNTFYRLPTVDSCQRWAESARGLRLRGQGQPLPTHVKRLIEFPQVVERFLERIEPLVDGGKIGPVLWQLPGNSGATTSGWPAPWGAPVLRPPRLRVSPSELVRRRRVFAASRARRRARDRRDDPERPFQTRELTASWTYVRLHRGSTSGQGAEGRGKYAPHELETWRRRIAAWRLAPRGLRVLQQRLGGLRAQERTGSLRARSDERIR